MLQQRRSNYRSRVPAFPSAYRRLMDGQLHRIGGRYALCTMCIGVGQGIAVIVERV